MKLKLGNSIALSMVAILFLSMMAIFPVHAQTEEIYMTYNATKVDAMNPIDGSTIGLGQNFSVTIWIQDYDNPNVFAWGVKLVVMNPAAGISIVDASIPNKATDPDYIFYNRGNSPLIDKSAFPTTVLLSDVILELPPGPGEVPPANPAKLAVVKFHIDNAPGKFETLETVINIENDKTLVGDDSDPTVWRNPTRTDGLYTWTWTPPTTIPHLAVVPSLVEMNPGPYYDAHVIGSTFSVQVVLKNLDVGWAITSVSFELKYNTSVIDTAIDGSEVVINTADWDGAFSVTVTHGIPDRIDIFVSTTKSLSGDVLIATITFTVMNQLDFPPAESPPDGKLTSPLDIQEEFLEDHEGPIPTEPSEDGLVYVYNYRSISPPWFEVSSVTLGPDLVIGEQYGKEFEITIDIKELDGGLKMVGLNFRLAYDDTLVQPLEVIEGPFLQDPTWNWYGTYPISSFPEPPVEGCPSTNIVFGDILLPNDDGVWDQPEPNGNGTICIIRFKALKQSWVDTYTTDLTLHGPPPSDHLSCWLVDEEGNTIEVNEEAIVPGLVTILPLAEVGRVIDVWMLNPPLGGQGAGQPADLVLPQMEITLTAKVTYNWQPVSYKKVTFEIVFISGEDPTLWAVLQDDTEDDGHATVTVRMPWTGQDGEQWIGKWCVIVSVTLADVVITDYMDFDYDYLIHIWSVTTDKLEYYKCNDVVITVTYGTKSKRMHDVTMYATIQDNLGVPIGIVSLAKTVGGGYFCHYKNFTDIVVTHVPTWAYAGMATVRVSFVSGLPSAQPPGEAVAQEVTATIYVLPVHVDDPWFEDP